MTVLLVLLLAFGLSSLFGGNGGNGLSLPIIAGGGEEPTAFSGAVPTLDVPPTPSEEPPSTTATTEPTQTPSLSTPPAPVVAPARLRLVPNRDDSLFLVNVGTDAVDLEELVLGDDRGEVNGEEWDISTLDPGQCVTVWKEQGQPEPPRVQCQEVGERLYRHGRELFWDRDYQVSYEGTLLATCERREDCLVELPVEED